MNLRDKKGSISIFVLVALLFMAGFLIISLANNVGKSKTIKEQFNIISDIYAYTEGDEGAYEKAYTDLREKNRQTMTSTSEGAEDTGTLELTKTFNENMSNYRIYGNSVQDTTNGNPSPTNPVEIQSLGDKVNLLDIAKPEDKSFIDFSEGKITITNTGDEYVLCSLEPEEFGYNLKHDETYTISCNVEGEFTGAIYAFFGTSIWPHKIKDGKWSHTFVYDSTRPDKARFYVLQNHTTQGINIQMVSDKLVLSNIQLEKGSERTEYTPYGKYRIPIKLTSENGESIQENIYLDEPLRKVGSVSDYIDFKEKKIVRNISIGNLSNVSSIYNKYTNVIRFAVHVPSMSYIVNGEMSLLSEFIGNRNSWGGDDEYIFRHSSTNNHFYLSLLKTKIGYEEGDTDEEIVKKANEYMSTLSNKKVYYPREEAIQAIIELPELNTYEDYTKIEVLTDVAPSKIEVEYQGYTLD